MTARIPKQVSHVVAERDHKFVTSSGETITGVVTNVYIPNSKKVTTISPENVTTLDNVPFDVTLHGIERIAYGNRYNGHHYFIGTDGERRFVNISEEELAYAVTQGIMPGGRTMSQFVWASMDAGGLTLVAVGSKQHERLVKSTAEYDRVVEQRRQLIESGESLYKVGHIYERKDCLQRYVYLGSVKEPGVESAYNAFVTLPSCPLCLPAAAVERDARIRSYRSDGRGESLEHALRWNDMSLYEQCAFAWRIYPELERIRQQKICGKQLPVGYYERYGDITLYSSQPQFKELEQFHDSHIQLVNETRLNSCGKHKYVNGHGEDKAEIAYARQQNVGLRYKPCYSMHNYDSEIKKYDASVKEWRLKYAASLQWSTIQA